MLLNLLAVVPPQNDLAHNFHTQVDRMAAHKMNFFSAMTTADIPFDIAKNGQWELEMQAYCADRHMTYVPSLNLGQTLSEVDGRTGEGIWAKDVPAHVGESGEIVPDSPPFLPLRNGAFEEGPATGAPLGWRVVGGGALSQTPPLRVRAPAPPRAGWRCRTTRGTTRACAAT